MGGNGRNGFWTQLLVLAVVGIALASALAMGMAAATDKYFARAIRSVLGEYGQYDLVFQVRTEFSAATEKELARLAAERFPGSRVVRGPSLAGKSTLFWAFSSPYRTREIFENLSYFFGSLPGNPGYSIIAEPRLVVSGVPPGARARLLRQFDNLPGVAFCFLDGENLNLLLRSPQMMETVRSRVRAILARYRVVEVRFPEATSLAELETWGRKITVALTRRAGVASAVDVTRSDTGSDSEAFSLTLSELRRFMASYAARVIVTPAAGVVLTPGESLVVQGLAPQPPRPGETDDGRFVLIRIEEVRDGRGEGIILRGDASYINDLHAWRLLPGGRIGDYAGTVAVDDEGAALAAALEEGVKLLRGLEEVAVDPAWGETERFLGELQRATQGMTGLERALKDFRQGLATTTAAEARRRLRDLGAQIHGLAGDFERLAQTVARVKMVEDRLATVLDRIGLFQWFLRRLAAKYPGPEDDPNGLGARLLIADRGLTALGEELRLRARRLDDLINRFNPFVQILLGWGERARVLADRLASFDGALAPGGEGEKTLAGLIGATEAVVARLTGFDEALRLLREATGVKENFSFLGGLDFAGMITQLERLRESLPRLLDEEIGRSIDLLDRYLGGEMVSGRQLRVMIGAEADRRAVWQTVRDVLGDKEAHLFIGPLGVLEPDFRGEILRVLAEVRTTITALLLLVFFLLEFIFDQSTVVVMLHRQAETVLRRVLKKRPRLFRLGLRLFSPGRIYATGFGALWLGGSFALTGARLPFLGPAGIPVLGGVLGFLLALLAPRLSPVDEEEVVAGESLGLSFGIIMREIVIPAGRPGLLALLNRRCLVMKGGRPPC